MRLILEGPDNAGKTTLAHRLVGAYPTITCFHPGGKPDNIDAEGVCVEEQLRLLSDNESIILDRCTPISQEVYNHEPALREWRLHMWQRYLALGVVVIYCRPSTDKLLRTQDFTWRDGEPEEHKQKIIRNQHLFVGRYDELMQRIPNVSYDYEDLAHAELIFNMASKALARDPIGLAWFHNTINYRT